METCEKCGDFVAETGACETCGESGFASAHGSTKYVPFTITVPELKPGQGVATRTLNVEVRISDGEEILTPSAMRNIETIKMQMNIIAFNSRNDMKRHVVFGHSSLGESATYCGYRFIQSRNPHSKQKRCKKCTKELKKAGMSWRWYEQYERAAESANDPSSAT